MFEFKGYTGAIDAADAETGWFTGSIIGIQDVVTFKGKTVPALQKAFRDSVNDYLDFCNELKEEPERPFSGKFVVRLSPELHRLTSEAARKVRTSLNSWVIAAVEQRLNQPISGSHPMPFEEMKQLAQCVAAILAEKPSTRIATVAGEKASESTTKTYVRILSVNRCQ
jgi:predicted HicB family RNase H-like nuclease